MKRKDFSHLKIATVQDKEHYFEHEDYIAGVTPYLRGIKSTMFVQNKWRTAKIIDISLPLTNVTEVKNQLEKGIHAFQLCFNESNHNQSVSKAEWLSTFEVLLPELKLENCTFIFDLNALSQSAISTFFEISKEVQELSVFKIALFIDISNETIVNNFLSNILNHFTVLLSSQNCNSVEELTRLLLVSNTFITTAIHQGIDVDSISKRIAFSLTITNNQFETIAKLRAARWLWAKFMKHLQAKNQYSYALHIHTICQSTLDIASSVFGGAQFITSHKQLQLFFELETKITNTVDPWAGSLFIEKTTKEIAETTWQKVITKLG